MTGRRSLTRLPRLVGATAALVTLGGLTAACGPRLPTLSVADTTCTEGAACTFTVSLSATRTTAVSFDYATASGQANTQADYVGTSGRATIAAGSRSVTVNVSSAGDPLDEDLEDFFLNLGNPSGATIADGQGRATISDDDPPPTLSVGDAAASEDLDSVEVPLTLSAPSGRTVEVDVITANVTARASQDYVAVSARYTFVPGWTTQTVSIGIIDDVLVEPGETFRVNLSGALNATIADGQGTVTIVSDDTPEPCLGAALLPC